ncbi:MAG: hypothetical protein A3K19_13735 [Lentisphaerae bacterium RIFOXYB12_FULL_65_16]|nr:MAG: hypothetical protein A3K18_00040 [Lentisphaerae bacterium RIFOXYA12_64_32]OGV84211.1 MAG: hypothetical protein A3K19_13735 [Lentisphaerae bacterium RIFOXYB12_FULL_65_16]
MGSPLIFIVSVMVFAAVRCMVTQPVSGGVRAPAVGAQPKRDAASGPSPEAGTVASQPAQPVVSWDSLRQSCRWLILVANFTLIGPVFLAVAGVGQALYGEEFPPWALLLLAIAVGVAIFLVWEDPTRSKVFRFAKDAVQARGVAPELLTDETFVGIATACSGERLGKCPDMVGFVDLTQDACILHTHEKEVIIPKVSLAPFSRCELHGETMGWMGVQPIAVSWRAGQGEEASTLYLIAKYAETSYGVAAATDMLFDRLRKWAPEAVPSAPTRSDG